MRDKHRKSTSGLRDDSKGTSSLPEGHLRSVPSGGNAGNATSGTSDPTTATPASGDAATIEICADCDLELIFEHELASKIYTARLRVKTASIRETSRYFALLLDPSRFAEGRQVAADRDELLLSDELSPGKGPRCLPQITIKDIGRISPVKSIEPLLADLMRLLHRLPTSNPKPPLSNLANLTVVADRFDCLPILRQYAHSSLLFTSLDAKSPRSKVQVSEERRRQRCFVGLQLEYASWLLNASQRLIQSSAFPGSDDTCPAWSDLPASLEDELFFRRCAILETIQDLQSYFFTRYTSRERQCKLGYDSSVACDGFQLGEMVKFFSRAGTLQLHSGLVPWAAETRDATSAGREQDGYVGDIVDLLDKLRKCPEYQIDSNHHHCGIRTRLLPLLDLIERAVEESGVCLDCWLARRKDYSWREVEPPITWRRDAPRGATASMSGPAMACGRRHDWPRDFCLARERVWERENTSNQMMVQSWSMSGKLEALLR